MINTMNKMAFYKVWEYKRPTAIFQDSIVCRDRDVNGTYLNAEISSRVNSLAYLLGFCSVSPHSKQAIYSNVCNNLFL